jgi:hypothetical protein
MEAVDNVSCLSALFNDLKDEDDVAFANAAGQLDVGQSDAPVLVGHVAKTMQGILDLAKASGVTATRVGGLKASVACVSAPRLEQVSFAAFAEAMKKAFIVDVVALHLTALESNLGASGFDAAFEALKNDRRVKKPELAEIASRFVSKTSRSAAKAQTLQRIYARHASLLDSANKREWQKGKSAA